MDGGRCLRWFAYGCVLAGAVGCNRNVPPSPFGQMPNTNGGPAPAAGVTDGPGSTAREGAP